MKTYYIMDSTIFSKAEDVVSALMSGETILNDDANLRFKVQKYYNKERLFVRDSFDSNDPQNWFHINNLDFSKPEMVVKAMDKIVEDQVLHNQVVTKIEW